MVLREFKNSFLELWHIGGDRYALTVISKPRLAKALNSVLNIYPPDSSFGEKEEPTFRFSLAQLKAIEQAIPKLGKIFAQVKI